MTVSKSLESLEQQRGDIVSQIADLGDLRSGSITSTVGRCGKSNRHCRPPRHPGHGPNLRLTYKLDGKTVTESLPDQVATRKAEREIAEFRKLQGLHKEFVEVNARIAEGDKQQVERAVQLDLPILVGEPIPILYVQMDGTGVPVVNKEAVGRHGKMDPNYVGPGGVSDPRYGFHHLHRRHRDRPRVWQATLCGSPEPRLEPRGKESRDGCWRQMDLESR
jgi:hypothetical protein